MYYGTALVVACVGLWIIMGPKPVPFHVKNVTPVVAKVWGINVFPLIQFMIRNLPDFLRKKLVAKMNAPTPDGSRDRSVNF